jgi:hypothetical protein
MIPANDTRETWLHGWPRMGTQVLIGTGVYCVGCGKDHGITTIAIPEGWEYWLQNRPYPDWPFDEASCPVCHVEDLYFRSQEDIEREWVQVGKDGMPVRDLRKKLPV